MAATDTLKTLPDSSMSADSTVPDTRCVFHALPKLLSVALVIPKQLQARLACRSLYSMLHFNMTSIRPKEGRKLSHMRAKSTPI
jgi:hypothetical protein